MARKLTTALKLLTTIAVLVVVALAGVGAFQHPDTDLPPSALGTHVALAGVPIRYAQAGSGPDVLLIHGSPGSLEDWAPIVERLGGRFRVTAFDRPGHGYSGGADLPHTPEENARVALELIHALRLQDVVLVGHSYGGMTALALAVGHPDEVKAFVIVASRAFGPVSVGPLFRLLAVPMLGAGLGAAVGPWIGPGQIASGIRTSFGPNLDRIPAGFVADRTRLWNRPTVTSTLSQERVTLGASLEAMAPRYREIRQPVFLVYGEQDERNYRDAQRLAREIPGARLTSLSNTGHYVQYARPDELARVIEEAAALRARAVPGSPQVDRHFPVGSAPGSVVVEDFNGDGKLDIATANERSADVSVLLGDGKAGFAPAPGSPFPAGPGPNDMAVGDFSRDGRLDLAFANHETQHLTVLLGDGHGGFAPAPRSPVVVAVRPHPHGIAAGDLNGDGLLDLVTDSWGEDRLELLFGDGKGDFATPGRYVAVGKHPYQRVRVADLDGDGKADIVSTNLEGNNVTILLGDGKGGFRQPPGSPFPCGDSPWSVAIGDVNADGIPDLAIVDSPASTSDRSGQDGLAILLGDGHGGFKASTASPFPTAKSPNRVAIGDLNGDGVADVVVSNPESDTLVVFTMSRSGSVAARSSLSVPGHPKGLAIRDLDGDGRGDIVVTNSAANTVTVILGR